MGSSSNCLGNTTPSRDFKGTATDDAGDLLMPDTGCENYSYMGGCRSEDDTGINVTGTVSSIGSLA